MGWCGGKSVHSSPLRRLIGGYIYLFQIKDHSIELDWIWQLRQFGVYEAPLKRPARNLGLKKV